MSWELIQQFDWRPLLATWGLRIAGALVLLLVGMRVVKWIVKLLEGGLERVQIEATAVSFLRRAAHGLLLSILVLAALQVLGVPMTSMLAVLGAAGLAIGLALKDSLSNIASGVMLVTLKPFRVGDVVRIASETGRVESLSIFQTKLRGPDNQTIVLPNALITAASIVNLTPDDMRRIELVIGIGYGDDIETARRTALDVIGKDTRVLSEPAPDVLVYELAASSVQLGIRCHVRNDDWFSTKCELTERIKTAFDGAGVSIPFPQRTLHVEGGRALGGGPAVGAS